MRFQSAHVHIRPVAGHIHACRPASRCCRDRIPCTVAWILAGQRCLGHICSAGGYLHRAIVGRMQIGAGWPVHAAGASGVGRAVAEAGESAAGWGSIGGAGFCGGIKVAGAPA